MSMNRLLFTGTAAAVTFVVGVVLGLVLDPGRSWLVPVGAGGLMGVWAYIKFPRFSRLGHGTAHNIA